MTTHAPERARIESVDVVRGIIMILMALDHTRDFFGDVSASPTNAATTTVPLFLTRWITHLCAPVFFLLTGTGARLALRRRGRAGLSRFLVSRGLWLVLLEFTLVRFFWQFNLDYRVTLLTVMWALGWCMVALGALVWLPGRAILAVGVGMIAFHNLFDGVRAQELGALAPLWTALHGPGPLWSDGTHLVFVAYPLVPWIGVPAVGFALGAVYEWPAERRRALLGRLGLAMVAAFVVLRLINVYGDPRPWTAQATPVRTVLAFLDTTKYPPSLLFLLMTLGPALLMLRALDGGTPGWLRPARVFGAVPLFYYGMHILLLHLGAAAASLARYGTARPMLESPDLGSFPVTQPPGWPAPLPVVWLIWIAAVTLLYPLCRWFAEVKRRRRDAWLSYL